MGFISYFLWDIELAHYFAQYQQTSVEHFFDIVTEFGDGFYWIVYPGIIYLSFRYIEHFPEKFIPLSDYIFRSRQAWMRLSLFILSTTAISGIIVNIFKLIFARFRPVELLENGNFGFNWFDYGYRLASFPSGHSATALSVAMAFALVFPKHRFWLLPMGFFVIFSRVVLTEHYLSDVLVGSVIGVYTSLYLYRKIYLTD